MPRQGFVEVTWIGGPYDGAGLELPSLYLGAQFIDLPDPATAANTDGAGEPAIYMGPSHRYRLERDAGALVARFVA